MRAFSGQLTESWHVPGWEGPVAGLINTTPLYAAFRRRTEALSALLTETQEALAQARAAKQHQQPGSARASKASKSSADTPKAEQAVRAAAGFGNAPAACSSDSSSAHGVHIDQPRHQDQDQTQEDLDLGIELPHFPPLYPIGPASAGGVAAAAEQALPALSLPQLEARAAAIKAARRALSHRLLSLIQRSYRPLGFTGMPR